MDMYLCENGYVENGIFWSEIGSGFGEPGGTPLPKIPRSSPLPRDFSTHVRTWKRLCVHCANVDFYKEPGMLLVNKT